MDDPLDELEHELRALRPRRPTPGLDARVARALEPAPAAPRASWPLAAAAALAVLGAFAGWRLLAPRSPSPSVAPALAARGPYEPVGATNVLYDFRDEGPVQPESGTSDRRVRARYVDTYTWRDPATRASLKWSVPRDEVRVIPASFH